MRKTIAYFLSLLLLFTLGILTLHPSYRALSDWLGPLLGSYIYTLFTLIYLLLANPLSYVTVALVWIIVGLIIGVISGKKLGASIIAFFVWFTTLPLLAASIAGIYLNLEARGVLGQESLDVLKYIPVVPDQLTFNNLFHIPIFSDLVFQIADIVPALREGTNMQLIIMRLVSPYIVAAASKPVLIIVSAIIGSIFSATIFEYVGKMIPTRKFTLGLLLIGLIVSQAVPSRAAIVYSDGLYTEVLGSYVDEQGRAILGELLLANKVQNIPLNTPEADGLIASIVITYKIYDHSILYTLPTKQMIEMLQFRNMLPSAFAVNAYIGDDADSIKEKSSQVISTLEENLGIEFHEITSIPIKNEGGPEAVFPSMTIVIYYSQNTMEETTTNILQGFENTRGFADFIGEKLDSGNPLDVEIYATGMVYIDPFKAMLPIPEVPPEYQELYDALIESRFSFLTGIQLVRDAVKPLGNGYIMDFKEIMGIQSTPKYSSHSDGSFIIMARSNLTGIADPLDPTVHIKTSLPETSTDLMFLTYFFQDMGAMELEAGSPTFADTQIFLPEIILSEVDVTKIGQQVTSGNIDITITVKNNGYKTISNLQLIDYFPEKYDILASGSNTASWISLSPGTTESLSYSVDLKKPGSYIDIPAILSYEIDETVAFTSSNVIQGKEVAPNPISMLLDDYRAATDLLDKTAEGRGRIPTYLLMFFVAVIVALDIFKIVKKNTKNDDSYEPKPV